eukprot:2385812-Pleurochrysis_carterae.AAC.1
MQTAASQGQVDLRGHHRHHAARRGGNNTANTSVHSPSCYLQNFATGFTRPPLRTQHAFFSCRQGYLAYIGETTYALVLLGLIAPQ